MKQIKLFKQEDILKESEYDFLLKKISENAVNISCSKYNKKSYYKGKEERNIDIIEDLLINGLEIKKVLEKYNVSIINLNSRILKKYGIGKKRLTAGLLRKTYLNNEWDKLGDGFKIWAINRLGGEK